MDLGVIIDKICRDMQHEFDCADALRSAEKLPLACYCEGVADGLRKALCYIEILQRTEKAAMPASTAADPLEKGDNDLQ